MEEINSTVSLPINKEISEVAPEPLSSLETAQIISEMYDITGPRIGSTLVEANNVLTIAGARGQTEFFIRNPTTQDRAVIEKLDSVFKPRGLSIRVVGDAFKRFDGVDSLMVNLESLRGYERVSKLTKIPGIKPFDSKNGWIGLRKWAGESLDSLEDEQKKGTIPFPKSEIIHIFAGIEKGYPDQAIYDAVEWWGLNDRKTPIQDSDIPNVKKYRGAEPNFDYRPDHADDPSILSTIKGWGKILEDFYNQPWHKDISQDQKFTDARVLRNQIKL